jgi:hypothetical protein
MKSRLTTEVIEKIRARMRDSEYRYIRRDINRLIGLSQTSSRIYGVLDANKWNGVLTADSVLKYLEDELGMTRDQLLETIDE